MRTHKLIPAFDILFKYSNFEELVCDAIRIGGHENDIFHDDKFEFHIPNSYALALTSYGHEVTMRGDISSKNVNFFKTVYSNKVNINGNISFVMHDVRINSEKSSVELQNHIAIALANELDSKDVIFIVGNSNDSDHLAIMALQNGFRVIHTKKILYTGRREVVLNYETATYWTKSRNSRRNYNQMGLTMWNEIFPCQRALRPYEMIKFEQADYHGQVDNRLKSIGYFDPIKHCIRGLDYMDIINKTPYKTIHAFSDGEAMALQLCLSCPTKINIIHGKAGGGKTFCAALTILVDMELGELKKYDRYIYVISESSRGKEHGFRPGEIDKKINCQTHPLKSNIREILRLAYGDEDELPVIDDRQHGKKRKNEDHDNVPKNRNFSTRAEEIFKKISFIPTEDLEGISELNTLFIVEESQHQTYENLKQILTRAGEGSKVIILGAEDQVVSKARNIEDGIAVCLHFLAGDPEVGVVEISGEENARRGPCVVANRCMPR